MSNTAYAVGVGVAAASITPVFYNNAGAWDTNSDTIAGTWQPLTTIGAIAGHTCVGIWQRTV